MKVRVVSIFRDKLTGRYYNPGEVIEITEESRVKDMESRRLAERVEISEVRTSEEKRSAKGSKMKEPLSE